MRWARCLVAILLATHALGGVTADDGELPAHPDLKVGALPNGLRYVVLPNVGPPKCASLRLVVKVGSLMERDDEQGLAHFVEHMAYRGSTHYAPGEFDRRLQSLGFGTFRDSNATTSVEATVYQLDLPETTDAIWTESLRVLADVADGITFPETEIQRQRGVVLNELRESESADQVIARRHDDCLVAGTRLAGRTPVGRSDCISRFRRGDFVAFYRRWYRPDRMVLVVAGDFEVGDVERRISAAMVMPACRAPAPEAPSRGSLDFSAGVRAYCGRNPTSPFVTATISTVAPGARAPDSIVARRKQLRLDLALRMLTARLEELTQGTDSPLVRVRAHVGSLLDFGTESMLELTCRPEEWRRAVSAGENELRRAVRHGFLAEELQRAKASYRAGEKADTAAASTRGCRGLADEIAECVISGRVFVTPGQLAALLRSDLETLGPGDCQETLAEYWRNSNRLVSLVGGLPDGVAAETVLEAYRTSAAIEVVPRTPRGEVSRFAYTDFGSPGTIVKRERIADLNTECVEFANGTRLAVRHTELEAGKVRLLVRVGDGQLSEPPGKPALSRVAGRALLAGGLGKHRSAEFADLFSGLHGSVEFRVDADAGVFIVECTPEGLLQHAQLVAAYLTDPGFRPEGLQVAQQMITDVYGRFARDLDGPLETTASRLMAGGDARFGWPAKDQVLGYTLQEIRQWLEPQLRHGAIDVAIVGDIGADAVVAAIAGTMGALPERDVRSVRTERRSLPRPAKPVACEYRVEAPPTQGLVMVAWRTDDASDFARLRGLQVLGEILSERLKAKLRSDMGATYSPSVMVDTNVVYSAWGSICAVALTDPTRAAEARDVMVALGDALATGDVSADELVRAKQPLFTRLQEAERSNAFLLEHVVAWTLTHPEMLDLHRTNRSGFAAVSGEEVTALARRYLRRELAWQFLVLPRVSESTGEK